MPGSLGHFEEKEKKQSIYRIVCRKFKVRQNRHKSALFRFEKRRSPSEAFCVILKERRGRHVQPVHTFERRSSPCEVLYGDLRGETGKAYDRCVGL